MFAWHPLPLGEWHVLWWIQKQRPRHGCGCSFSGSLSIDSAYGSVGAEPPMRPGALETCRRQRCGDFLKSLWDNLGKGGVFSFLDRISLCNPVRPITLNSPASASWVLGLQTCIIIPGSGLFIIWTDAFDLIILWTTKAQECYFLPNWNIVKCLINITKECACVYTDTHFIIICRFCICKFAYLLKCISNFKINIHGALLVICRHE
jgi:hypothetical protein